MALYEIIDIRGNVLATVRGRWLARLIDRLVSGKPRPGVDALTDYRKVRAG